MEEVTFISAPLKHIHHAVNGGFINPYFKLFTSQSFSRTYGCFHINSLKEQFPRHPGPVKPTFAAAADSAFVAICDKVKRRQQGDESEDYHIDDKTDTNYF